MQDRGQPARRWSDVRWVVRGFAALAVCAGSAAQALTIGALVPQSWPNAARGEEIVMGMQLAIKTWPGQPVPKLVVKDTACDPRKADAAARELVAAKVDVVLGSWCAIGNAPMIVTEAGVPYVSAHAERLTRQSDQLVQLGRIEVYAAERLAAKLRAETGLRISARTSCWMDFEPVLREQYDAILCPALGQDEARWKHAEATFTAGMRLPFTQSVARGYAAMEAGLTQVRRLKSGRGGEPLTTVLGRVPAAGEPPPPDALQLILAPKLPRLGKREQAALDQLLQTKACCPSGGCASKGAWADEPFVVRGQSAKCPVVATSAVGADVR